MGDSSTPLRILFAGTPEIAFFSLDRLIENGGSEYVIVGVLTNPDRPAGRGRTPMPPPVKIRAERAGLQVLQPERLAGDARDAVKKLKPDLLVSVAYGRIFGPRFMGLFPLGGINLHPSLLPRHRGPSPLQAAILAGDGETGVTIQKIAPELDSGAILAQERVTIDRSTTVEDLHDRLGAMGASLLVDVVRRYAAGTAVAREQDHQAATFCGKISKEDGRVTWNETAEELDRMVRAFTPWPGVKCRWGSSALQITAASAVTVDDVHIAGSASPAAEGERVSGPGTVVGVDNSRGILIQTVDGLLAVSRLKQEARKELDFLSFLNGNQGFVGTVLK